MNKPDLNAPRFRKKICTTLNIDILKEIKNKLPECKELKLEEIKKIIHTFNENIWKTVIKTRDGVDLPAQIGHLFIGTCPASKKKPNVDLKTSIEYLKKIQHRNWESDQHIAKIFFTTFGSKYRFRNHEIWAFDATRDFKREVAKTYPENWKKYVEVDPCVKISNVYKSNSYKLDKKDEQQEQLKYYNEFDI